MRIGLITGEFPPMQGGISHYTAILSRQLAALGHDVFVFSAAEAEQQDAAIPVTNNQHGWGLRGIRAIQAWVQANQLDVVDLQFQTAAYDMSAWVHFLPHLLSVPFVTTFHDLRFPYLFPKAGRLRDWIVMHLARASAGVIVTNAEDYARVQDLHHVQMIPLGSSIAKLPANYDQQQWRGNAQASDFLAVFFGFMNHTKGFDILLRSIEQVEETGIPIKLLVIGGSVGASDPTNAAYRAEIEQLITDLALDVQWTGYATDEDVAAYLQAADVVALPFQDGASYRRSSLIAAIQLGCAIVTTTPTTPQPHFSADNLYSVPANDVYALADALKALYNSPPQREKLQAGARELRQHFDWQTIASDTATFLEQVLE